MYFILFYFIGCMHINHKSTGMNDCVDYLVGLVFFCVGVRERTLSSRYCI